MTVWWWWWLLGKYETEIMYTVLTDSQKTKCNDDIPACIQISQGFVKNVAFINVSYDVVGYIRFQPVFDLNQLTRDAAVEQWLTVNKRW